MENNIKGNAEDAVVEVEPARSAEEQVLRQADEQPVDGEAEARETHLADAAQAVEDARNKVANEEEALELAKKSLADAEAKHAELAGKE